MKLGWFCGALAVVMFVACTGPTINVTNPDNKTEKSDKDKIQGTWVVELMEVNGQKIPNDKAGDTKMVFSGDKVTLKGGPGKEKDAPFKLDSSKTPKTLEISPPAGETKAMKAIYKFEGEKLKLAMLMDDSDGFPTTFSREGREDDAHGVDPEARKVS